MVNWLRHFSLRVEADQAERSNDLVDDAPDCLPSSSHHPIQLHLLPPYSPLLVKISLIAKPIKAVGLIQSASWWEILHSPLSHGWSRHY